MTIEHAREADIPAILALQKLAFLSEAKLYDDYSIPPLTQTEESLRAEFSRAVFLNAVEDLVLVGSIRPSNTRNADANPALLAPLGTVVISRAADRSPPWDSSRRS